MTHARTTRLQAAALFGAGLRRAEVARRLGISRSTSSAWYELWTRGDLLARRRRGRRPQMTWQQLAWLGRALLEPPTAHGLPGPTWSLRSVALLVERETGIRYHHRHVPRLLRRTGWTAPPVARHADHARFIQPIDTPAGPMNLLVAPYSRHDPR